MRLDVLSHACGQGIMSFSEEGMKRVRLVNLGMMLLGFCFFLGANASQPASKGLTGEEFKEAFMRDCSRITGIEELHSATYYTVDGTYKGARTREHFSLKTMLSWLEKCGGDPKSISQIME